MSSGLSRGSFFSCLPMNAAVSQLEPAALETLERQEKGGGGFGGLPKVGLPKLPFGKKAEEPQAEEVAAGAHSGGSTLAAGAHPPPSTLAAGAAARNEGLIRPTTRGGEVAAGDSQDAFRI